MLEVVYVVGSGRPTAGVTGASMCNLGTLAWPDMNACTDAHNCTTLNA